MYNNQYKNISIPKELNMIVQQSIKKNKRKRQAILSFAASLLVLFTFSVSLNVSPTFADIVEDIPVISQIASWLTFKEYTLKNEDMTKAVKQPIIVVEEDLDQYINTIIEKRVQSVLEEAELRVEEYKAAYLDTGGTIEGFKAKNMNVTVDYEILYESDDYISFRVYSHETLAAAYSENLYFTLDLKSKKNLNLLDLLGENYQIKLTDYVREIIKKHPEEYFELDPSFEVRQDIDFYISSPSSLNIVFDKYEIAPGAKGRIEFNYDIEK